MSSINLEDTLDVLNLGSVPFDSSKTNFLAEHDGQLKKIAGETIAGAGTGGSTEGSVHVGEPTEDEENVEKPGYNADSLGGVEADGWVKKNDLSDAFDPEKDYAVGEYCIYENVLYKFTTAKEAGEWDASLVTSVKVADEIWEVNNITYPNLGSGVDLWSNNSWSNAYTIPNDGYILMVSGNTMHDRVSLWLNNIEVCIARNYGGAVVDFRNSYVRKGMRVHHRSDDDTGGIMMYYPLISSID